jgi:phenylalanyl-tRNA synthetase beta chain
MTVTAALRAASLIVELAGGEASVVSDVKTVDHFPPFEVLFSLSKARRLIGKSIPDPELREILEALEIEVQPQTDTDLWKLLVPPYRVDVRREVDVIEDVLRVYGYNQVEMAAEMHSTLSFQQYRDVYRLKERYADFLSANGFYEVMNNSLISKHLGNEQAVPIVNPLSEDLGIMRQSMLPGILESLRYNQNRQQDHLSLYEFGKTYRLKGSGYEEKEWLVLAISGNSFPNKHWKETPITASQTGIQREVERLQAWFGFEGQTRELPEHPDFSYGLELLVNGQVILTYGKVSPAWMKRYSLRNEVFCVQIVWEKLVQLYFGSKPEFQPIPQYPGIRRDISMIIDKSLSFQQIQAVIFKANPKLIRKVELHDVYEGENIRAGAKSYLVSIELRDSEKTLADKAADKVIARVYQLLQSEFTVEIRS